MYFNLPPSGIVCVFVCVRERERDTESVCIGVYGGAYGYSCAMRGM